MPNIVSTDVVSHPIFAIVKLDSGRTVKYPKTKPTGASDANDAAWQARMATEIGLSLNQVMNGGTTATPRNATHYLASLV